MTLRSNPDRLDLRALAQAVQPLSGQWPLSQLARLGDELAAPAEDRQVSWTATAEWRKPRLLTGIEREDAPVLWLRLTAQVHLPQTCQRCLGVVETEVQVDRWFRFVADEATAAIEDEEAEEDVLVFGSPFDLIALLEDELILALPLVPMHERCPQPLPAPTDDTPVTEETRPHPFAALAQLRKPRPH